MYAWVDMNVRVYKGAPRMRICLHGYPLPTRSIKGLPLIDVNSKPIHSDEE